MKSDLRGSGQGIGALNAPMVLACIVWLLEVFVLFFLTPAIRSSSLGTCMSIGFVPGSLCLFARPWFWAGVIPAPLAFTAFMLRFTRGPLRLKVAVAGLFCVMFLLIFLYMYTPDQWEFEFLP